MEYLSEIISFLAGLATGWTMKIKLSKSDNSVTQKNIHANGDVVGRDKSK